VHNPHTIDPEIERRIIELRREHPDWGKKRIARWIWKEHGWKRVVAIETVRKVLKRHGLWKNGERKKKRKNRGTTADRQTPEKGEEDAVATEDGGLDISQEKMSYDEKMNVVITSLMAIMVIIDNCTRKCLGLPVFIKGWKVTADDVIKALENRLLPELKYIISDNGKQFVAEAFKRLCMGKGIVHVRITRHRPATNGIAERFVRRLKEMLAERE